MKSGPLETQPDSVQAFLDILHGSWKSQALHAAAELGIPDVLAGGPRTAGEVADAVAAAERPVRQLLRALCTIGVCVTADGDRFGLGPMGEPLRSNAATPLRDWTRWWGKHLWGPWGVLDQCVRSGQSGRRILGGTTGFEHLTDPVTAALFHRAVAELTAVAAAGIVAAVDFSRFGTVMDVGGGGGELLGAVLAANPSVTGLMLEREHAIATARGLLEAAGVLSRCTLLEGDFFEHVPPTADAYLLKSILHDWDDEECVAVLASVRQAMHGRESAGVTLLVIEQVMPDRPGMHRSDQAFVRSDLMMLVAHGSCERTASEFAALLTRSGFAARSVTPAGLAFSVIEAMPV